MTVNRKSSGVRVYEAVDRQTLSMERTGARDDH